MRKETKKIAQALLDVGEHDRVTIIEGAIQSHVFAG